MQRWWAAGNTRRRDPSWHPVRVAARGQAWPRHAAAVLPGRRIRRVHPAVLDGLGTVCAPGSLGDCGTLGGNPGVWCLASWSTHMSHVMVHTTDCVWRFRFRFAPRTVRRRPSAAPGQALRAGQGTCPEGRAALAWGDRRWASSGVAIGVAEMRWHWPLGACQRVAVRGYRGRAVCPGEVVHGGWGRRPGRGSGGCR
jgi:hypothetical protein